jgi:hypothetical protein
MKGKEMYIVLGIAVLALIFYFSTKAKATTTANVSGIINKGTTTSSSNSQLGTVGSIFSGIWGFLGGKTTTTPNTNTTNTNTGSSITGYTNTFLNNGYTDNKDGTFTDPDNGNVYDGVTGALITNIHNATNWDNTVKLRSRSTLSWN